MKTFATVIFLLLLSTCATTPRKGEYCAFRKGGESNYINCVVNENFDAMKSCYKVSPAAKTYEELKILFKFTVAADGKVTEVKPQTQARHIELAKCQQMEFSKMLFPELGKNEISQGEYVFWVRAIIN